MYERAIAKAMAGEIEIELATDLVDLHNRVCRQIFCRGVRLSAQPYKYSGKCGKILDSRTAGLTVYSEDAMLKSVPVCIYCAKKVKMAIKENVDACGIVRFVLASDYRTDGTPKPKPKFKGKLGHVSVRRINENICAYRNDSRPMYIKRVDIGSKDHHRVLRVSRPQGVDTVTLLGTGKKIKISFDHLTLEPSSMV
tara:strand:+ start:231 stop:818 length:588 start_codon:yes stop_codon:yes gene_type:complete